MDRHLSQGREHTGSKRGDAGRALREPNAPKPTSESREYGDLLGDAARILREPKLPRSTSEVPEYGDLLRRPGSAKKPSNEWQHPKSAAAEPWSRATGVSAMREAGAFSSPHPKDAAQVIRSSLSVPRSYPDIIPIISPVITPTTSARDAMGARVGRTDQKWDSARRARQTERQRSIISPLRTKSPDDLATGASSSRSQRLAGNTHSIRRSESVDQLTVRRAPTSARRRAPGAPVASSVLADALLDLRGQIPRERTERTVLPTAPTPGNVEPPHELRLYPFSSEQRRNAGSRPRLRPNAATASSPRLQQMPQPTLLSDMPLPFKLPQ
jgi:hypothetical protein